MNFPGEISDFPWPQTGSTQKSANFDAANVRKYARPRWLSFRVGELPSWIPFLSWHVVDFMRTP